MRAPHYSRSGRKNPEDRHTHRYQDCCHMQDSIRPGPEGEFLGLGMISPTLRIEETEMAISFHCPPDLEGLYHTNRRASPLRHHAL